MTRPTDLEVIRRPAVGPVTGPPVILVHGAWHAAWCWDEGFAERLASWGHDVHALSLRGHGASVCRRGSWRVRIRDHVADLRRVIAALDGPAILVGHSRGAFVVQKHLETGEAAGAVLLAPLPHFGVAPCMARLARAVPWAVLRMHATLGAATVASTPSVTRRLFLSPDMPEEVVLRHHARLRGESFLAYLDLLGLDLCRPRKGAVPTMVLGAGADAMFTRREVEAVAAAHGATVEFVPGMAHDMMLVPGWETVADRIAGWARAVAAPQAGDRLGAPRRRPLAPDDVRRPASSEPRHDPRADVRRDP